jgi:uncharacterized membrane protein YphA (DoxX/SURF4 family)
MTTRPQLEHRAAHLLAGLRVFMGLLFLVVWALNLGKGLYGAEYLPFIRGYAQNSDIALYRHFLESVVIPNATLFRSLQFITESVVMGIFLIVGFLTPLSSLVAAGFTVNLLLASFGSREWPGTYLLMLALLVAVGIGQAGRTWGVDARLARRNADPSVPLY